MSKDLREGTGFEVTTTGTGAALFNIGAAGAAFGVGNNTNLAVYDILRATNSMSVGGTIYSTQSLRNLAIEVYDAINRSGDII